MSRTFRNEKYPRAPRARYAPSADELARLDARREHARNWIDRSGIKPLDRREGFSDAFEPREIGCTVNADGAVVYFPVRRRKAGAL